MGALLKWRPPGAGRSLPWKAGLWDPAGARLAAEATFFCLELRSLGVPAAPGRGTPPQVGGERRGGSRRPLSPTLAPRERQEQLMGYRKRGPKPKPLVVQVRPRLEPFP